MREEGLKCGDDESDIERDVKAWKKDTLVKTNEDAEKLADLRNQKDERDNASGRKEREFD